MSSLSEKLELLEDKIHFLAVRLTQISEENIYLKDELKKERKKNESLHLEIDVLKVERDKFDQLKNSVRKKIEILIDQLALGQNSPTEKTPVEKTALYPHQITPEESRALNKPLKDDLLTDTAINFFPEEDI